MKQEDEIEELKKQVQQLRGKVLEGMEGAERGGLVRRLCFGYNLGKCPDAVSGGYHMCTTVHCHRPRAAASGACSAQNT